MDQDYKEAFGLEAAEESAPEEQPAAEPAVSEEATETEPETRPVMSQEERARQAAGR